jgi:hypothetical protein
MKKILTLLIAVATLSVCTVSESNAQFSAGLRLGVNASTFTGSDATGAKFVPGLHIGPYFRMAFKEKYRVQIDVLFSTKGAVYNTFALDGSAQKDYIVPFYIDVPLMFNYKPIAGLYVEAGVQPSIALTELTFDKNDPSKFTSPSAAGYKSVIVSPIAGVGYEFKKVSLGMRAAFGGTSIAKPISYYGYTSNNNVKNLTLMATFGFKF